MEKTQRNACFHVYSSLPRKERNDSMLCQNCKKNEASTHIKRIINGESATYHLCRDCASSFGFSDSFSDFSLNLSELFGGFLGDLPVSTLSNRVIRCEKCGSTFDDIAKSGRVGCADCYSLFYDKLLPSLQRIHGRTKHEGKIAQSAGAEIKREREISDLRQEMNQSVGEQDFERAARLRDKIKELEDSNRERDDTSPREV